MVVDRSRPCELSEARDRPAHVALSKVTDVLSPPELTPARAWLPRPSAPGTLPGTWEGRGVRVIMMRWWWCRALVQTSLASIRTITLPRRAQLEEVKDSCDLRWW
jgi:hypothetical protein